MLIQTVHCAVVLPYVALGRDKGVILGAGAGVFGVEMFLLEDGGLLLNEVAPRPHNSGHYTIEACATSQYEQHLRAVMGWPLGDTSLAVGAWWVGHSSLVEPVCVYSTGFLNSHL